MKENGFTLLEMLIAVAVVGILAAIAYPSYQDSVRKTRRSDGIAAALEIQLEQEKLRGSCRFYGQTLAASSACGTSAALTTVRGSTTSPEGFYALSIQANSATGNAYVIVVDPQGQQAADTACDPMTITFGTAANQVNGLKAPAECW